MLGREFLSNNKLTMIYNPSDEGSAERVGLFSNLPLSVKDSSASDDLETKIENTSIDFGGKDKDRLKEIISNVNKESMVPVEDDYAVRV